MSRRQDLTSRECSSILGGVIGGMVECWGIVTTRDLVRIFARILRGDVTAALTSDAEGVARRVGSKEISSILGTTVNALDANGRESAALDGLVWWAERTDAEWDQIVATVSISFGDPA